MVSLETIQQAAKAASGPRPNFLENADCDRLLSMILAMGAQISMLNDRLDNALLILERNNLIDRESIENFQPDSAIQSERLTRDQAFVTRLLRVLDYEFEALKDSQISK